MDITNLIKKLKEAKTIDSLVGEFTFIQQIGEGGNSNVCLYKKNDIEFAIKFFSKGIDDSAKTKRFIDEYFGMAQIPSHPNIAEYLHLDTTTLHDESYLIIIMKRYATTLKGTLEGEDDKSIYAKKLELLYTDLLKAIEHLHVNGIIHRDIKPQNILIDGKTGHYVLSDFGISKFDPESFAKEAETRAGDRLANYRYCSPEQRGKGFLATISSDLYSFAQVIQEYATGDINHGGGRTPVKFQDIEFLKIVDKVINRCLMHKPEERFDNVDELRKFMHEESDKYKRHLQYLEKQKYATDSWNYLYKLNEAISKGFPTIKTFGEITEPAKMVRFFNCIDATIQSEEHKDNLWLIDSGGGDLNYFGAKHISGNEFEINYGGFLYQSRIRKILVHRSDGSIYKHYFIVLVEAMEPFEYDDIADLSVKKAREYYPKKVDHTVMWEDHNLDPDDTENMYIEIEGAVYENNRDSFRMMHRYVATEALFVSPRDVFGYGVNVNDNVKLLLEKCIRENTLSVEANRQFWKRAGWHYANWISSNI
ncbi:protein kinase [Enterobacteriaceae bacterium RIT691]|nr:protein kinase [Enterobacteriaceae bacterium RIT691]